MKRWWWLPVLLVILVLCLYAAWTAPESAAVTLEQTRVCMWTWVVGLLRYRFCFFV